MSREYTAVPTDVLEAQQEARELENINQATKARRDDAARQEANCKLQDYINRQIAEEQEAAIFKVIIETIFGLAGIAALVLFAHKGAVSGWVMHVGTMALAGWLGYEFGRAVRA